MPTFAAFTEALPAVTDPGAGDAIPLVRDGADYSVDPTYFTGSGLTEPLTSLLPLFKITDSGYGSAPTVFDPDNTLWDDGSFASLDWHPGLGVDGQDLRFHIAAGTGGLSWLDLYLENDNGYRWAKLVGQILNDAQDNPVWWYLTAEMNPDGTSKWAEMQLKAGLTTLKLHIDDERTYIEAIARSGQTDSLFNLTDPDEIPVFSVYPNGRVYTTLPTSNPGAGYLWNDANTVKVGT